MQHKAFTQASVMYLAFYNLQQKPFQISTDPKFLWLGEKHEEALATLRYGVEDNKGFLLLTGDVGTGKTTLINALLKTLGEDILVATIRDPSLEPLDFYNYTAHVFGMKETYASKAHFLIQFERFLLDTYNSGKKILLIIDEAQRISQELLEEVRLLSNIEREDTKLLNIFFVGQHEFNDILLKPDNRAIRQRITINYNILPLSIQETRRYIQHRLEVAGSEETIFVLEELRDKSRRQFVTHSLNPPENTHEIFSEGAIKEIYSYSKGYPRLINIICDRALLTGFVEESKIITAEQVLECAGELEIPCSQKKSSTIEDNVAGNIETPGVSPAAEGMPVAPASQTRIPDREKVNTVSKSFVYTTTLLFLALISYIIFSLNDLQTFPGKSFLSNIQTFFSTSGDEATSPTPTDSDLKNRPDTLSPQGKKTVGDMPDQSKSVPEKKDRQQDVEEKTAVLPSAKEEKPYSDQGKAIINPNLEIVSGGTNDKKNDADPKQTTAPLQATDTRMEINQIATREIQVQSVNEFKKLIISFPSNSNLPPAASFVQLDQLVEVLKKQPQHTIVVTGFTDSQGNDSFNEKLSEFRANAVKSYLVGKGLEEYRIVTVGMGSRHPIASNDTYSGRMANRRVEIEIE